MHLSETGTIVESEWDSLPDRFPSANLDSFMIMPNHIHAIVVINDLRSRKSVRNRVTMNKGVMNHAPTLGAKVRSLKAVTTRKIRSANLAEHVWQRNYYEHVIRNERALSTIRAYIEYNPLLWPWDSHNPELALTGTQPPCVGELYGFTADESIILKELLIP